MLSLSPNKQTYISWSQFQELLLFIGQQNFQQKNSLIKNNKKIFPSYPFARNNPIFFLNISIKGHFLLFRIKEFQTHQCIKTSNPIYTHTSSYFLIRKSNTKSSIKWNKSLTLVPKVRYKDVDHINGFTDITTIVCWNDIWTQRKLSSDFRRVLLYCVWLCLWNYL